MYDPVPMGVTPEHWVTHQNGESRHLKYHFQLKTKDDVEGGESAIGGYQEKYRKPG